MKRFLILSFICLAVGTLATLGTVDIVRHSARRYDHQRFDRLGERIQDEFRRRMKENELGLIAVQCLFSAKEEVEFDEFNELIRRIRSGDKLLDSAAFGYLEVVPDQPGAMQDFKEEMASYGLPDRNVFTLGDIGLEFEGCDRRSAGQHASSMGLVDVTRDRLVCVRVMIFALRSS